MNVLSEPFNWPKTICICLIVLSSVAIAQFMQQVLLPITLSLLLFLLLNPIAEWLHKFSLPRSLCALLTLGLLLTPLFTVGNLLMIPAVQWLKESPANLIEIRSSIKGLEQPLKQVRDASAAVEKVVGDFSPNNRPYTPTVKMHNPTLFNEALQRIPQSLISFSLTITLTFLLLSRGKRPLLKVLIWRKGISSHKRALLAVRNIQKELPNYLLTTVLINSGLACMSSLCFWWLELPNPLLWGCVVGILNFAPYIGAIASTALIAIIGLMEFSDPSRALQPALAFLAITIFEGQIISPMVLGRRLDLNPFITACSVIFMGWLWGLTGALIAVPLLKTGLVLHQSLSSEPPQSIYSNNPRKNHQDKDLVALTPTDQTSS